MEINGFENYLIYEDGSIYSNKSKKYLKSTDSVHGYLRVKLCNNGKPKDFYIHRLLGLHYIPNPHNYSEIDHIDRNRKNNSIDNLRWVTKTMNNQNKGLLKSNKLQIKYISHHKIVGYMFQKTVNGKTHRKWFKTLEETIKYKEEYLANLDRDNN